MADRYTVLGSIAKGGMAEVYLGRMVASAGFTRPVAIKRLHDALRTDPEFVGMLVDEARLTARIRHTNVVDILDVVVKDSTFALVLEWVEGASLGVLMTRARKAQEPIPAPIVHALMVGILRGLAAAHEARDEDGHPLGIVHRDVSPQNVLVGVDGIPRIIDFGVAKAFGKLEETRPGEIRGKYAYMAPEQLMGRPVTCQIDVYAAGVVMWELATGKRLFKYDDERVVSAAVLRGAIEDPSTVCPDVSAETAAVIMKAVAREPSSRYLDAREMLAALERLPQATEREISAWVRAHATDIIEKHQRLLQSAPPASARSLDAILSELGPSSSASGVTSERPTNPPTPAPFAMSTPPRSGLNDSWRLGLLACAAIATLAVVLGVVALTTASIRRANATQPPPPELASEPPPPAREASTVVPLPTTFVASEPEPNDNAGAPAAPPRVKVKPKPRASAPPRDPTDHR